MTRAGAGVAHKIDLEQPRQGKSGQAQTMEENKESQNARAMAAGQRHQRSSGWMQVEGDGIRLRSSEIRTHSSFIADCFIACSDSLLKALPVPSGQEQSIISSN